MECLWVISVEAGLQIWGPSYYDNNFFLLCKYLYTVSNGFGAYFLGLFQGKM